MVLNFGGECGNSLSLGFPMKVKDLWAWGAWTDTVLSNSYSSCHNRFFNYSQTATKPSQQTPRSPALSKSPSVPTPPCYLDRELGGSGAGLGLQSLKADPHYQRCCSLPTQQCSLESQLGLRFASLGAQSLKAVLLYQGHWTLAMLCSSLESEMGGSGVRCRAPNPQCSSTLTGVLCCTHTAVLSGI